MTGRIPFLKQWFCSDVPSQPPPGGLESLLNPVQRLDGRTTPFGCGPQREAGFRVSHQREGGPFDNSVKIQSELCYIFENNIASFSLLTVLTGIRTKGNYSEMSL